MNPRIFGATVVGLMLVIGVYIETQNSIVPANQIGQLKVGNNPSARSYIKTTDHDGDGVADWRQALRVTDPLELQNVSTSTYVTPETVTDQFAVQLFSKMLESKSYGDFGATPEDIIEEAHQSLVTQAKDILYYEKDIKILSTSSPESGRVYANRVAQITLEFGMPIDTRDEIDILDQAVKENNPDILKELEIITNSHAGTLDALLNTPVPTHLVKEHLDLINVYQALLTDLEAMQTAFDDPIFAILRLKRHQDDMIGLYHAFINVFTVAAETGTRFEVGDIALELVTIDYD